MPRLLSKEVAHTCTPNLRTSLVHTGKRAFELAQEYSITNSRLALGSTLVLGGVLALSQVQSAEAADHSFIDASSFAFAAAQAQADATESAARIINGFVPSSITTQTAAASVAASVPAITKRPPGKTTGRVVMSS